MQSILEEEKQKNSRIINTIGNNEIIYSKKDIYVIINNIIDQYSKLPEKIINKSELIDSSEWYWSDEWIFNIPM